MKKKAKKAIVFLFLCIMSISITLSSIPLGCAASDYDIMYETKSTSKSNLNSTITITNNSIKEIDQWKLEFDWDKKITNISNAKIVSSENNHYVITYTKCNKVILPEKSITLKLKACTDNTTSEPLNFVISDIYDKLAQKDKEWQQYSTIKTGEEFQKFYANGFAYVMSKFPTDEPHRIGYEIIQKNPVGKFIQSKYHNVVIPSKDGIKLKGLFFPVKNAKGTIIMLHGYGSTAIWETAKLKYLLDNGYQILSYNSRYWNYYKTPEKYVELMSNEVKDVECAVDYLKRRNDVDKNKIGIYGFSYGANKIEIYAPMKNIVKVFIIDGGSANIPTYSSYFTWDMLKNDVINILKEEYGDDPNFWSEDSIKSQSPYLASMSKVTKPTLFIHGLNDTNPVSEVEAIYNASTGPKEMYVFPNSGHCDAMYTVDKDDYTSKVLGFLEKYLK